MSYDSLYFSQLSNSFGGDEAIGLSEFDMFGKSNELIHADMNSITTVVQEASVQQSTTKTMYQFNIPDVNNFYNYGRSYFLIQGWITDSSDARLSGVNGVGGVRNIHAQFRQATLQVDGVKVEDIMNYEYTSEIKTKVQFSQSGERYLSQEGIYVDNGSCSGQDPRDATSGALIPQRNAAQFKRYQRASLDSTWIGSDYDAIDTAGLFTSKCVTFRIPVWRVFDSLRAYDKLMKGHLLNMTFIRTSNRTMPVLIGPTANGTAASADTYQFVINKFQLYLNLVEPPPPVKATLMSGLSANERSISRFDLWYATQNIGASTIGTGAGSAIFTCVTPGPRIEKAYVVMLPTAPTSGYSSINPFALLNANKGSLLNWETAQLTVNSIMTNLQPFNMYSGSNTQAPSAFDSSTVGGDFTQMYAQYCLCAGRDNIIKDGPLLSYDDFVQQQFFAFDCSQLPEPLTAAGAILNFRITWSACAAQLVPWIVLQCRQVMEIVGVSQPILRNI